MFDTHISAQKINSLNINCPGLLQGPDYPNLPFNLNLFFPPKNNYLNIPKPVKR